MALDIYSKSGIIKATIQPSDTDRCTKGVMEAGVLSLSFVLPSFVSFAMGDYTEFLGERYEVVADYTPEMRSTCEYHYSLKLYDSVALLERAIVLKPADVQVELGFAYYATAQEHLQLVVDNINRTLPDGGWTVGTVSESDHINIDYANKTCLAALAEISSKFELEWWVEGRTINLSRCEHGDPLPLGYASGLIALKPMDSSLLPTTRLYPLGSTRNIDRSAYGSARLKMPHDRSSVERNTHLGIIERAEESAFSHIYPRYTGTVGEVRHEARQGKDGKAFTVYYIKDANIPFNPNAQELPSLTKHIVLQSGELNGHDFEANYDPKKQEWELITQYPTPETQLPREPLVPKVGDKYIPYNFRMPDEYIRMAERELEEAAMAYLEKISQDTTIYKCQTDYVEMLERGEILRVGRRVLLQDEHLFARTSGRHSSRITRLSIKINNPSEVEFDCSYAVDFGRLSRIEGNVVQLDSALKEARANLPTILKSWDSADPSEYNVLSAIRTLLTIQRTALRKDQDDYTEHTIGSAGVIPGLSGWMLKPNGDAYLRNLKVAGAIEVDEFRKNRITILEGEHYFSSGTAVVKEVNVTEGYIIDTLASGDHTSLQVGDYCLGKWVGAGGTVEVAKIKIARIEGDRIYYTLAPNTTTHPRIGMHIAQVRHEIIDARQRATVVRNNVIIQYAGLNGWDIEPGHITGLYGDLDGFVLPDFGALRGSGLMTTNAYIAGRLAVQSADGTSVKPLGYDKGDWRRGMSVYPYDKVIYGDIVWMWMGNEPTESEPNVNNPNWVDMGITAEQAAREVAAREVARANGGLSAELRDLIDKANGRVDDISNKVAAYKLSHLSEIEALQRQIDGQTDRWFGSGIAQVGVPPTDLWERSDDAKHEGDTYTCVSPQGVTITSDNASQYPNVGKSWRWTGRGGRYGWELIADTDVTRALAIASEAQAAADGKISHYYAATPPDVYHKGDLLTLSERWSNHEAGTILTAVRDSGGGYPPRDWVEANRYGRLSQYALSQAEQASQDAEEARRAAARLDYLRTALKEGSTITEGGLTIGDIIAIKDRKGDVVGYLNGLVNHPHDPMLALGVQEFGTGRETAAIEMYPYGDAKFGLMRLLQTPFGTQMLFADPTNISRQILKLGADMPIPNLEDTPEPKSHRTYLSPDDYTPRRIVLGRQSINGETIGRSNFVSYSDTSPWVYRSIPLAEGMVLRITGQYSVHVSTSQPKGLVVGWVSVTIVNRNGGRYKPYKIPYAIDVSKTSSATVDVNIDYSATSSGEYYVSTAVMMDSLPQEGVSGYAEVSVEGVTLTTESIYPATLTIGDKGLGFASSPNHILSMSTDPSQPLLYGRGVLNLPGVLLAGRVVQRSNGTIEVVGLWGYYARAASATAYRYAGGHMLYQIYHKIGHADYSVQLTIEDSRDVISYHEVSSDHFNVRQRNGASEEAYVNSGFSFMCIGRNE